MNVRLASLVLLPAVTFTALVLCITSAGPSSTLGGAQSSGAEGTPVVVELRGNVVCLAEEMSRRWQTDLPTGHSHLYGFRTTNDTFYTLLRVKTSEALFADDKVRERELLLKGRVFPRSHLFEPATMKSVRNGIVFDLYYWCNICSVQTIIPGECPCCRDPVELVEKQDRR
jgi:hypothetical protein